MSYEFTSQMTHTIEGPVVVTRMTLNQGAEPFTVATAAAHMVAADDATFAAYREVMRKSFAAFVQKLGAVPAHSGSRVENPDGSTEPATMPDDDKRLTVYGLKLRELAEIETAYIARHGEGVVVTDSCDSAEEFMWAMKALQLFAAREGFFAENRQAGKPK